MKWMKPVFEIHFLGGSEGGGGGGDKKKREKRLFSFLYRSDIRLLD